MRLKTILVGFFFLAYIGQATSEMYLLQLKDGTTEFVEAPPNATKAELAQALRELRAKEQKIKDEVSRRLEEIDPFRVEERLLEAEFARYPAREPSVFDDIAEFFGFGYRARAKEKTKTIGRCKNLASNIYKERMWELQEDPSQWQLAGYKNAEDMAGASYQIAYNSCSK